MPQYEHLDVMQSLGINPKDLPESIRGHVFSHEKRRAAAKKPEVIEELEEYSEIISELITGWHDEHINTPPSPPAPQDPPSPPPPHQDPPSPPPAPPAPQDPPSPPPAPPAPQDPPSPPPVEKKNGGWGLDFLNDL